VDEVGSSLSIELTRVPAPLRIAEVSRRTKPGLRPATAGSPLVANSCARRASQTDLPDR